MLAEEGDLLKTIIEQTVQRVLEAEMDEALHAGKSERNENRLGYRSGYYGRTLVTRVGKIELRVPQDRQGHFRTEVFERYQRSEKALVAAMLEMRTSRFFTCESSWAKTPRSSRASRS